MDSQEHPFSRNRVLLVPGSPDWLLLWVPPNYAHQGVVYLWRNPHASKTKRRWHWDIRVQDYRHDGVSPDRWRAICDDPAAFLLEVTL